MYSWLTRRNDKSFIGFYEKCSAVISLAVSSFQNVKIQCHPPWYWSLKLVILDENLANQSFGDIIQISKFVELAFGLRNIRAKTFLHAYTPRHISKTGRPKSKRKIYLLSGFILK